MTIGCCTEWKWRSLAFAIFQCSVLSMSPVWSSDLDRALRDTKQWVKQQHKGSEALFESANLDEFLEESRAFDPQEARSRMLSGEVADTDISQFARQSAEYAGANQTLDPDESLFVMSDEIAQSSSFSNSMVMEEGVTYDLQTCLQSGDAYPLVFDRELHVSVAVSEPLKTCCGHNYKQKYGSKKKARADEEALGAKLQGDNSLATWACSYFKKGNSSKWIVKGEWIHFDNQTTCDSFLQEGETTWTESDSWSYPDGDYLETAQSPNATLLSTRCLEPNQERVINGQKIHRNCWKQRLSFLCVPNGVDECASYASRNCVFVGKECVEWKGDVCTLWKRQYKCLSSIQRGYTATGPFGSKGELAESYQPNASLADVSLKLSVFAEVKRELEDSNKDITDISLFKGRKKSCKKNVLGNLLYDCCFSMGGARYGDLLGKVLC